MLRVFIFILILSTYNTSSANFGLCRDLFTSPHPSAHSPATFALIEERETLFTQLKNTNSRWFSWYYTQSIHNIHKKIAQESARQNPGLPQPILMNKFYIGEQFWTTSPLPGGGIRQRVGYLTKDELNALQVEVTPQGLKHTQSGTPFETVVSGIFVISTDGQLYVKWRDLERPFNFRHSSFFSGMPVLFAGYIQINPRGQVLDISNSSGHYTPSKSQLMWAIEHLNKLGFDTRAAVIRDASKK